jgi:hypothetical protein
METNTHPDAINPPADSATQSPEELPDSYDYPNFNDTPPEDLPPPPTEEKLCIMHPAPHAVTRRDDFHREIAPPGCLAVRADGVPFAFQAARDTYNLPNVELEPLPQLAELCVSAQISPDINSPEYKERPALIREAYRQHKKAMPKLPPLHTLDDYINMAIYIMRCYSTHTELYQLVRDCQEFCHPHDKSAVEKYYRPYERAGNYVEPDVSDHDPAPIDLYIQRARKKAVVGINRMLNRTVHEFKEVDPERIQNLLALATATKYVSQSDPLARKGPGRPFEADSRLLKRLMAKDGRGGARAGAGRPRKTKQTHEDEIKKRPEKSETTR